MLFDTTHIVYIVCSFGVTLPIVFSLSFIKNKKNKGFVLKIFAVLTILLHFSNLWINFFQTGSLEIPVYILFPIFFCNIGMYLLFIVAFWRNKESKIFNNVAIFSAYAGIIGALVTIFYADPYLRSGNMFDWETMKSMLSHNTMLIGCLYLFIGGFVKIRVSNLIPFSIGLLVCGLNGLIINILFILSGHSSPNSMYLMWSAIPELPFTMGWWIALILIGIVFILSMIWEFFLPKTERWYYKIYDYFKSIKNNRINKKS